MTLLELLVALTLGGIAVLAASALLDGVRDSSQRVENRARAITLGGSNLHLVRSLFERAQGDGVRALTFDGSPTVARFESRCEVPGGWLARCTVELRLVTVSNRERELRVVWNGVQPRPLGRLHESAKFLFRASGDNSGLWTSSWGRGIDTPTLVALVHLGDTTHFVFGVGR